MNRGGGEGGCTGVGEVVREEHERAGGEVRVALPLGAAVVEVEEALLLRIA